MTFIMLKHVKAGKHTEYIHQKLKIHNAYCQILSRDEVLTLFYFIFFSFRDEYSLQRKLVSSKCHLTITSG